MLAAIAFRLGGITSWILLSGATQFFPYLRVRLSKGAGSWLLDDTICWETKSLLPGQFVQTLVFHPALVQTCASVSSERLSHRCELTLSTARFERPDNAWILKPAEATESKPQTQDQGSKDLLVWFYNFFGHVLSIIVKGLWLTYILLLSECVCCTIGCLIGHSQPAET